MVTEFRATIVNENPCHFCEGIAFPFRLFCAPGGIVNIVRDIQILNRHTYIKIYAMNLIGGSGGVRIT